MQKAKKAGWPGVFAQAMRVASCAAVLLFLAGSAFSLETGKKGVDGSSPVAETDAAAASQSMMKSAEVSKASEWLDAANKQVAAAHASGDGGGLPKAASGLRFSKAKAKTKFVGGMLAGAAIGGAMGAMGMGMMGMGGYPAGYANPYPRYKYGHGYMFNSQWQMNMYNSPRAKQGLGTYIGPCIGQC